MANQWYLPAVEKVLKANADFDTLDLRVMLCMSNTTADTERNVSTLAGFTTLDEYDGAGYTPIDLAGVSIAVDAANGRVEIDYNDGSFGAAVAAGTRNWAGFLFYVHVDGTDANDWPVAWQDLAAANGNGGPLNLTVGAEGLLQGTI